jgi:hypothetical protein
VVLAGTPASSTTKTGRHDIAEILLKAALSTRNKIQSNPIMTTYRPGKTSVCLTNGMISMIRTLCDHSVFLIFSVFVVAVLFFVFVLAILFRHFGVIAPKTVFGFASISF